jgi:hypothetical protein
MQKMKSGPPAVLVFVILSSTSAKPEPSMINVSIADISFAFATRQSATAVPDAVIHAIADRRNNPSGEKELRISTRSQLT